MAELPALPWPLFYEGLVTMRIFIVGLALSLISAAAPAQDIDPGRRAFESVCGRCHGGDGNGSEMLSLIHISEPTRPY